MKNEITADEFQDVLIEACEASGYYCKGCEMYFNCPMNETDKKEDTTMIKVFHNERFMEQMFPKYRHSIVMVSNLKEVALVDCEELQDAFRLTNNIDHAWSENPEVTVMSTDWDAGRSTSVGDVLQTPDGEFHLVASVGFRKMVLMKSEGLPDFLMTDE